MAFAAIMHTLFPREIPFNELSAATQERNFTLAFSVAEKHGVFPLLDVEDMVAMSRPDPLSGVSCVHVLMKMSGCTSA